MNLRPITHLPTWDALDTFIEGVGVCDECGALVENAPAGIDAHDAFHKRLGQVAKDADTARMRTARIG